MIKPIIVALVLCIIEFLVIVLASPLAKPSLVLPFQPDKNQIIRIIAYTFLSMLLSGVFMLVK